MWNWKPELAHPTIVSDWRPGGHIFHLGNVLLLGVDGLLCGGRGRGYGPGEEDGGYALFCML